jgi:uncharacterized repeat protein (TIGR03803 family)
MVAAALSLAMADGTLEVIHSFGEGDGEYPSTELVMDGAGSLYGTTVTGGTYGGGSIFRLTPDGAGGWTETLLYSFTGGKDGGQPYGGVTLDGAGNLYGSAVIGGSGGACPEDGCGVVYRLSNVNGTWTHKVLHDFTGTNDGYGPGAGVTFDAAGNLYGMTPTGGAYGLGTIYQLVPGPNDKWGLRVIHTFTGGIDGGTGSAGRLLLDETGSLLGVATIGGEYGQGIVFQLTPGANGKFKMTTLYSFRGEPDAGFPYSGLVKDAAGNLYGTSYYSGAHGDGAVYQLIPHGNGRYKEKVIHSFEGGDGGAYPISTLAMSGGALYGTTSEEGAGGCGCGTIYKMSQDASGKWQHTVVYSFTGAPDAAFSYSGMVADGTGNLFGTTVHGGEDNDGTVFQFTP